MEYTFKGTVGHVNDSSLMWNHRITVPDDIVQQFKGTDKRIICTINGSEALHCALMSNGDGTYYVMMNNAFRKKYRIDSLDEVVVTVKKDDSKYGMAVPDFFEELCFQDPEADNFFHALTPGKQRSLLHIVSKVKSEEKGDSCAGCENVFRTSGNSGGLYGDKAASGCGDGLGLDVCRWRFVARRGL